MNKKIFLKFLLCFALTVAAIGVAVAQPGPGGMRGGFGRGMQSPPGPPAPVPPEVAIPRPTAEELAKMNADLKKFIAHVAGQGAEAKI